MSRLIGDQQLPTMRLEWQDGTKAVIDLSAFTAAKVVVKTAANKLVLTKTSGIVLAATSPNYVITWSAADITTLAPTTGIATYKILAYAKRTADSLWDCFSPKNPPVLEVEAVPV